MADTQILYDASGNPVGRFAGPDRQDEAPAPTTQLSAAPAPTTQQVQATAEASTAGEVIGEDTYIPFGPAVQIGQDPETGEDIDPGFRYAWTDGVGARRLFRIAGSIGMMPLLRFAHSAKVGLDTEDLEGMAALYDMVRDCVHPDDWDAFQVYATQTKADDEDLMDFVGSAMEIISARPRKPRGSSSATSRGTSQKSRGNSSRLDSVIPAGTVRPAEIDGLMPVADLVK